MPPPTLSKWLRELSNNKKMIYMKHNIGKNFMSADGVGDEKMKQDIIMSEIAKLIIGCPDRVIMHLQEAGIKFKGYPNRKVLVRAVTEAMHNSQAFAKAMMTDVVAGACNGKKAQSAEDSFSMTAAEKRDCQRRGGVMVMNQGSGQYECSAITAKRNGAMLSVDDNAATVGSKTPVDWGSLLGSVGVLTAAAGSIFGGKDKNKNPKVAGVKKNGAEKDLLDKTNTIGDDNKSSIGKKIAIGIGVALLVTGIGYGIYRMSHKKAA